MWEHYRKTFRWFQAGIWIATIAIYFWLHCTPAAAAVFFGMMQVGGLLGAVWANRLRRKIAAAP
jgi:hypothetical protein